MSQQPIKILITMFPKLSVPPWAAQGESINKLNPFALLHFSRQIEGKGLPSALSPGIEAKLALQAHRLLCADGKLETKSCSPYDVAG